jgi:hypothetical protein|tara:strand:+ start:225 stop:515 length:291 start_codon:yes stop_codon:yes gene_type:complete
MALPAISAGLRVATAIAKRSGKKLVRKYLKKRPTFGQEYVRKLYKTHPGVAQMKYGPPVMPGEAVRKTKKLGRKSAILYAGMTTSAGGAAGGIFKG